MEWGDLSNNELRSRLEQRGVAGARRLADQRDDPAIAQAITIALESTQPILYARREHRAAQARREKFLEIAKEHPEYTIVQLCAATGIHENTYTQWRKKWPEFVARLRLARGRTTNDNGRKLPFTEFRKAYFGMDTTWFQQVAVDALEQCKPGEIILLLFAPEHGKTSLVEDFINYRLAIDPQARITVCSEKRSHAIKILRRVKARMQPDGPAKGYVTAFGPFVPDEGRTDQPWANDHFDVRQRGAFDERDYNAVATGIGTGIQGTRADWLIMDDIQALKSLNLTESYVDIIRQDFFSRPGIFGRICLLGTRVGNDDVYERLIDEGLIDKLIVFPAHDGEGKWLWPERYSADDYQRLRKRVGDQAWFRNYMQKPSAAQDATFTKEMIDPCKDFTRSVIADCPRWRDEHGIERATPVVVTCDPALGGANAICALGLHPRHLLYLDGRVDHGLTRTEQIFDLIEQTIIRWTLPGESFVTEVVIEQNNFQRGMLDDDRMREIVRRHGVRVVPHQTTASKMDENIGVPAMALAFLRQEILLPYADAPSRNRTDELVHELCAWKPYKKGARLRQDRVMALHFGFRRWRGNKAQTHVDPGQFSTRPSPLRAVS